MIGKKERVKLLFLSTLSLRRATTNPRRRPPQLPNFYPRSPCGERRVSAAYPAYSDDFYPRSPCGERPGVSLDRTEYWTISIHALLAESDQTRRCKRTLRQHFYPRSPCGERLYGFCEGGVPLLFLSTLSLRRATTL